MKKNTPTPDPFTILKIHPIKLSTSHNPNQKLLINKNSYSALGFIVSKPNNDVDRLFVFFPSEESVGVDPIRKLTQRMMQNSVNHAIIVYRKTITSSANKVIATLAGAVKIEQFQESELLVNITKHELVPKHLVMSDEEKKVLLSRYRLKETQLPRIQHSDPVARYYGLARGQVVKIIRNSETAGRYVTYRICM